MAAILTILKALGRVVKRDTGTLSSVGLNNLCLFAVMLAYSSIVSGLAPVAAMPYFVLLALIIIFPLSTDPLSRIPPVRLALWPLTRKQSVQLRLASLGLSPIVWIGLILVVAARRWTWTILFVTTALAAQILSALGSRLLERIPSLHPFRITPPIPGRLGGIVRHNIRLILSTMDFFAALALSITSVYYRFAEQPSEAAYPFIAMLIALALSTHTQCSFGLDSSSGLIRYRLLPLRGWHILLAKDLAFLAVLFILTLPTGSGVLAGFTFGLIVIAIGRYPSLVLRKPQNRWRFTSGSVKFSIFQFVAAPLVTLGMLRVSPWFLAGALVVYLLSLLIGGWYWNSRMTLYDSRLADTPYIAAQTESFTPLAGSIRTNVEE